MANRLLITTFFIFSFIWLKAERCIYIWAEGNSYPTKFMFEEEPIIKFGEECMTICTMTNIIEFSSKSLIRFCFEDSSNEIQEIKQVNYPIIKVYNNEIFITGIQSVLLITIHSISNDLKVVGKPNNIGEFFTILKPGFYVIRIGDMAFKIKI